MGEGEEHGTVIADVDQVVGRERVARLERTRAGWTFGAQAEDHAGRRLGVGSRGHRVDAERQGIQGIRPVPPVVRQINAEVGQRQIGNRHSGRQILQVDDRVL